MTVSTLGAIRRYQGLSSDTKPVLATSTRAVPDGSTFYETDTGRTFAFGDGTWQLQDEPLSNSTIERLLAQQNQILRGIRFGLSALTETDLSEIN